MNIGLGSLFGADLISGLMQIEAQDRNAEDRQRDAFNHAERMRATAYQATMEDMRLAGLNPILAASRGPTAAAASPAPTGGGGDFGVATRSFSAYHNAEVAKSQDMLLRSQIQLSGEQATATAKQGNLYEAEAAARWASIPGISKEEALKLSQITLNQASAVREAATARQSDAQTANIQQDLEILVERAKAFRTEGKIDDSFFGEVMRIVNRITSSVVGRGGAINR